MAMTSTASRIPTIRPRVEYCRNSGESGPASSSVRICLRSVGVYTRAPIRIASA